MKKPADSPFAQGISLLSRDNYPIFAIIMVIIILPLPIKSPALAVKAAANIILVTSNKSLCLNRRAIKRREKCQLTKRQTRKFERREEEREKKSTAPEETMMITCSRDWHSEMGIREKKQRERLRKPYNIARVSF